MINNNSSHFYDVLGSKMHVQDSGSGRPLLFLHGNPSNSYLWRNIAPQVQDMGRVIVPDLIGMGKSDKPDIQYTFFDHYRYVEALIEQLELKDVILILHDWGSALGFNYFANNSDNVAGIAFMEGIIQDVSTFFPLETLEFFKGLRTPDGHTKVVVEDLFMQTVLPSWVDRPLSDDELAAYREPFATEASREVIYKWICSVPLEGQPSEVANVVENYRNALKESKIPKLFFHAEPGAFMPPVVADWIIENIPNLKAVDVGKGSHFIQEDHPELIGNSIRQWLLTQKFTELDQE